MKKTTFLLLIWFSIMQGQTLVNQYFSELKGIEDQFSNTHLFYRIFQETVIQNYTETKKNINHMDLNTSKDTLFLKDSVLIRTDRVIYFHTVNYFDFWKNDLKKFIYCGMWVDFLVLKGFINRYDGTICNVSGFFNNIIISQQNPSKVFTDGFISTDYGINWIKTTSFNELVSIDPNNDNNLFVIKNMKFNKSTNGGNSFYQVDTTTHSYTGSPNNPQFLYDKDNLHLYRVYKDKDNNYFLTISDNAGENLSWQIKYNSKRKISITNDTSTFGKLFMSEGKTIYISTNYGNTFTPFKTFNRDVTGIYKKSGTNKLYATTTYQLLEITNDSVKVLKEIPILPDAIKYENQFVTSFQLHQNFPNPFNPTTKISYTIPLSPPFLKGESGAGGFVTLKVYDLLGKEVALLVNENQNAGSYSVDFSGKNLSAGIYFYELKAGEYRDIKKMLLLK